METTPQPIIYSNNSTDSFFRKKYNSTVSFAIGILLFLLPFIQLKCGSVTIAENSGIGLATGSDWKVSMLGGSNELFKALDSTKTNSEKKSLKIDPNWFILLALIFGVIGLVVTLIKWNMKNIASMCVGILAAVMLLAAMIHLRVLIKSQMPTGNKNDSLDMGGMGGVVGISFTAWFYMAMAAFTAAAFFSYRHYKNELDDALAKVIDFEFQKRQQQL